MKILITGATGFIGSYVYKKIIQTDYQIYAISRIEHIGLPNFYQLDILNHKAVDNFIAYIKPDVLIHLAWDVEHGEFWNSRNNFTYADASINLFSCFIKNGGRKILAAGTCAEYPTSPKAVSEHCSYEEELSVYGNAKKLVYQYLESQLKTFVFDFTWFRIFGIFGLGEDKKRFFPSVIHAIKSREIFEIKTPDAFVDYVYVGDLASFIIDCIQKDGLTAINIGTGNSISIVDMYKTIENYINCGSFKIIKTITEAGKNSRIPNCYKLKKCNNIFDIKHGLIEMVSHYI